MALRISAKATFLSLSKSFRKRSEKARRSRYRKEKNIPGYAMEKVINSYSQPQQAYFFTNGRLGITKCEVEVICPQPQEIIRSGSHATGRGRTFLHRAHFVRSFG